MAVYGINFDTGKATLRPDSDAALLEIAKLLSSNPALKLRVEGHTDNVGAKAANQALSEQRASAVVAHPTLVFRSHVLVARPLLLSRGPQEAKRGPRAKEIPSCEALMCGSCSRFLFLRCPVARTRWWAPPP